MANGASRLFEVMKNTGESTNNTPSQLVSLTIKSVNPLILVRDDRLEIPAEFCILHKSLNINNFRINDVVTAIVLNNGQQYFIIYNNTAEEQGANYNDLSNKPKINDIELNGNKTSNDLGLLNKVINVVVANTDLDDYKEDGEFYFGVDYTPTNIPVGVNGWLKVVTGVQQGYNIVKQIWYRHGTPNSNDYETYVRTFSSNIWSSWKMFGMQSNIDSLNNSKVNKSGDTLTGYLDFENKNEFHALIKTRTVNGTDYQVAVGVGANNSARMECVQNDNVLSSIEARSDGGIYNGKTGNRLIETKSEIVYSNWHSVVLTRSDQTNLLVMLYGSNQLKAGTYSVANNFKLVCYGTSYAELTIPKSAITNILRFDWGFELVINRSQISGNPSGELNGTAVVYDGPLTLHSS